MVSAVFSCANASKENDDPREIAINIGTNFRVSMTTPFTQIYESLL